MDNINDAIKDLASGKAIIVIDDKSRENEGDLICAAEHITPETITFMAREACGLICLAMTNEDADRLNLPPMVSNNTAAHGTNFTIPIDAAKGISTGISAADRSLTIKLASNPHSKPADFLRPGHIFPLRAVEGGVCVREGHTEAVVDLARLAGLKPMAAICEVMNEDGTMARPNQLMQFAQKHGLRTINVSQVRHHRLATENMIKRTESSRIPTRHGVLRVMSFSIHYTNEEAIALILGHPEKELAPLIRVHSECITGESLGSLKCDCGPQLDASLQEMKKEGSGVVVYLRQEGRGIGIHNKLKAYKLQEEGLDTVEANLALGLPIDKREYAVAAQILKYLKCSTIRLISNNPLKVDGLRSYGITVSDRVSLPAQLTTENSKYLLTKRDKLGHHLVF